MRRRPIVLLVLSAALVLAQLVLAPRVALAQPATTPRPAQPARPQTPPAQQQAQTTPPAQPAQPGGPAAQTSPATGTGGTDTSGPQVPPPPPSEPNGQQPSGPSQQATTGEDGASSGGQCGGPRIVRVRFQGLVRVSAGDIRDSVRAREGSCYVRAQLSRDARSLWDLGFFSDVQVAADPTDQGGIEVRFIVEERPSIHEVRLDRQEGESVEEDKIREVVDLREGSVLAEAAVRRNAQNIRDLYAERGYFLAEVRSEIVRREGQDNEADVVYHIRENAQVQVRSIAFVGNSNIPADELRGSMATQVGGFFSFLTQSGTYREEAFRNDIDLLHAAYYDRGYLNVEIENPRVALSPDRRFLDITIFVREGPRYRLGRVRVLEVDEDDNEVEPLGGRRRVREFLHLNPGDYFARSTIGRDILALQTHYRDAGYASVEVTPDIQPRSADRAVDLSLRIRRGSLTYVHRVIIRGNQKTADRVIRRELQIFEGDRYSETRYQGSRTRAMQLGYFERVDLSTEPVPDHPDRIIVNVEVVERPTGTFQVGAGFSSVESFIATAQIQQLNLFGRGQALTLQAQISALRQIFALRFVEPYLFDSMWTGAVDVYNTLRVFPEFSRTATGGSLSAGYPLIGTNDLRLAATYTGEYVTTLGSGVASGLLGQNAVPTALRQAPLPNRFQRGFTSALGLSLTLDTRNDRMFPTSGLFARVGVEVADPVTGSENTYMRWSAFFRFYIPLPAGFVIKANITGGLVTSRNPIGVPIFERYYLGGILDVRGFRLRTLGPRLPLNSATDPNSTVVGLGPNVGGNLQFYYNLEFEFPILTQVGVRGVIFHDAGNVWNLESRFCEASRGVYQNPVQDVINPCNPNPFALRTSVGFGVRWFSPLGLLRFEWGFPLFRLPGEEPSVFEFTIGNFF